MAASSAKSVSVKFSELRDAFEFVSVAAQYEHQAYICASTGRIYWVSDATPDEEELPEDLETSDDYIGVPHKHDLDLGQSLIFAFIRREMPGDYDDVRDIFRKRGAYSRFKNFLRYRNMLEKWYAYEESATEEGLRAWCESVGIRLTASTTTDIA